MLTLHTLATSHTCERHVEEEWRQINTIQTLMLGPVLVNGPILTAILTVSALKFLNVPVTHG